MNQGHFRLDRLDVFGGAAFTFGSLWAPAFDLPSRHRAAWPWSLEPSLWTLAWLGSDLSLVSNLFFDRVLSHNNGFILHQ